MNKKVKGGIVACGILVSFGVALFLFHGTASHAASDYGLGATAGAAKLTKQDIPTVAGNVIAAVLSLVGVLFFGLMVYGGLLWMTARGNEDQVTKAKNTIIASIIGIVIIFAAYAISNFVFSALSGESPVVGPAPGATGLTGTCVDELSRDQCPGGTDAECDAARPICDTLSGWCISGSPRSCPVLENDPQSSCNAGEICMPHL